MNIIKYLSLTVFLCILTCVRSAYSVEPEIPKGHIPTNIDPFVTEQIFKLYSPDPENRWRAAHYLGKLADRSKPAIPFLVSMLRDSTDWGPTIFLRLNPTENDPNFGNVGEECAKALGKLGEITLLMAALTNENATVRRNAPLGLAILKDNRAISPLIRTLNEPDLTTRANAAFALGEIKTKLAVEPLITYLKDKAGDYNEEAMIALGKIGDARAVDPLLQALKADWYTHRKTAAMALGRIGDSRAVDPLIRALGDKEHDVVEASAVALGQIGDKRAVDPLIDALSKNNSNIRTAAAQALGQIRDQRAVEPLMLALYRGRQGHGLDYRFQLVAVQALNKLTGKNLDEEQWLKRINNPNFTGR